MIYICDDIFTADDAWLRQAFDLLPRQRRARALRYKRVTDSVLSAAAYLLLRYGLRKECGLYLTDDFVYTTNGKPYLSKYPNAQFSISHCKDAVAVAIADAAVGIDVESVNRYDADVAKYCCNADELLQIEHSADKSLKFIEIWTKKESLLKRNGDAAPIDLKNMLNGVDNFFRSFSTERYVCTVCTDANAALDVIGVRSSELL